jgi:putative ABC transport system permease protein
MIYLKLAGRNLARSLRDYAIYFFTVTFSVVILYSFNSLKDQPVIVAACLQAGMSTRAIGIMLGATSVFVSFIVAALVLYSNNFIIRRRKRELGIYLLLGMEPKTVARMLFVETLAVGALAVLLGIGLGILLSGVFSAFFAVLMGAAIPPVLFSFSSDSALLTAVFYGLIFVSVGLLASINVSRFTLASLLVAQRTNQEFKPRNGWVTGICGFISLAILAEGYSLAVRAIATPDFNPANQVFFLVAGLVIIGSFGFFYAGIGFIFNLLKKVERFRWKGLNTFTMQQIMKNINTNTLVLTATNLLLAMTITSVVFLVFFKTLFDVEKTSGLPYAYAVLYLDPEKDLSGFDQAANVDPQNPVLRKLSITSYQVQVPVSDLELPGQADANQSILQAGNSACSAVGEDEYNAIRAAKSLASIQLSETEAAVQIGTMQASLDEALRQAAAHALPVTIGARQYRIKQVITSSFVSDIFTSPCSLVLPQAAMSGLSKKHGQTTLLFDYANGKDPLVEKSLEKEIYAVGHGDWTSRGEEAANLQDGQK